jgi:uncharacterized protein DUF6438
MFWTITRRTIASIVGFFLGWTIFQVVRPIANLPAITNPAAQVLEIKLNSLGCADAESECPVFEMTLRSNGTGSFVGQANHWLKGRFEASVPEHEFNYLVEEIYKQEFFQLPEHYSTGTADETIVVEVVTNEGSRRVISDSWDSMDERLRALHARLWYEHYYVNWEEVK